MQLVDAPGSMHDIFLDGVIPNLSFVKVSALRERGKCFQQNHKTVNLSEC